MIGQLMSLVGRYFKLGSNTVVRFQTSPLCNIKCVLSEPTSSADRTYKKTEY